MLFVNHFPKSFWKEGEREREKPFYKKVSPSRGLIPLFFLIIQPTMAKPFKVGVGDLLPELLAHTFELRAFAHAAGAVAVLGFQSLLDEFDLLFVVVESDFHSIAPFGGFLIIIPNCLRFCKRAYKNGARNSRPV